MLQPIADIVKLLFKEELRPKAADHFVFLLAPIISATAAFAAFAVVPFGAPTDFFGLLPEPIPLKVADVNVGILVLFAVTSLGVYGIVLAGWSSNSKYSLLGGLRTSAQMISYELAYGLSLASVLLLGNSLSLARRGRTRRRATGSASSRSGSSSLQPVGFVIFMIAGIAETNRAPFDFPEAEQELVAGYHTEYSSMALRAVLPGRVHQHGRRVGRRGQPVPRRLARPAAARAGSAGSGSSSRSSACCSSTSGCGGRCRATATTS